MSQLPSPYQQFIHKSRYSRWLNKEKRRETYAETVARYFDFLEKFANERKITAFSDYPNLRERLENAVLNLEVMPSMRALMTAGPALEKNHIAAFNCSFAAIDRVQAFDEILLILMHGSGVGFSVERQYVKNLPSVAEDFHSTDTTIVVPDSRIGWAKSLRELIGLLYQGQIPKWDLSKLRPAGAVLKTFGGRSSGPEPLERLFYFTVNLFKNAAGRKLTSLECHDLVCSIADCVVVGGVRRSALISLSNLSDDRMRHAKSGQWWEQNGQRALANNSAAYTEKPDIGIFMDEWKSLYDSKSGERGIFNRDAAIRKMARTERRDENFEWGTNPCGEILLRDREFCNLTEAVIREDDDMETLENKVEIATILGTFQSMLTDFKYISKKWKENCEEERLLGVSLTGIMDNAMTNGKSEGLNERLQKLREKAIQTNKEWSKILEINESAAITTCKPSGTVSQLVDAASGIHPRHSQYYVRTVRADNADPLCKMMIDQGFPYEPCVMKPDHVTVFSFPIKSPENAVFRDSLTAIEQLEIWKSYSEHWCEHNPSITVTVREHEWLRVGSWVYDNFDAMLGVSFLPHSDHVYKQAPYQECSKEDYEKLLEAMPDAVDWQMLSEYENHDETAGTQTLACTGSSCEIVDITDA